MNHQIASALCVVAMLGTAPRIAAAGPAQKVRATVEVDTSDVGDAGPIIQRRVEERTDVVLRDAEVLPAESADDPVIHIEVHEMSDEDPGFAFDLQIMQAGKPVGQRRRIECNLCTETEIVAKIETEVSAVLVDLPTSFADARSSDTNTPNDASTPSDPTEASTVSDDGGTDKGARGKLGNKGKAGVGLLVAGGVATAVGIGLAIPGYEPLEDDPTRESSPRPYGFATLGVGVVVAITGAVLLGLDRRERRQRRVAASIDVRAGGGALTLMGRF
jgi:hypothetical protein